jgi:hypothetical protein
VSNFECISEWDVAGLSEAGSFRLPDRDGEACGLGANVTRLAREPRGVSARLDDREGAVFGLLGSRAGRDGEGRKSGDNGRRSGNTRVGTSNMDVERAKLARREPGREPMLSAGGWKRSSSIISLSSLISSEGLAVSCDWTVSVFAVGSGDGWNDACVGVSGGSMMVGGKAFGFCCLPKSREKDADILVLELPLVLLAPVDVEAKDRWELAESEGVREEE